MTIIRDLSLHAQIVRAEKENQRLTLQAERETASHRITLQHILAHLDDGNIKAATNRCALALAAYDLKR